jgi:hypothetical protein
MSKTLCEYSAKQIQDKLEKLSEIVAVSNYICKKCARSASEKKYLCKGIQLHKSKS